MDVTRILEADHRRAEQLIGNINRHKGDARTEYIDCLADMLRKHMELEETVVYGVMKEVLGEESVKEANTEHELARKALADVLRLAPDEPGFGAALDALEAGLSHHIGEEESDVWPELRKNKEGMAAMATPFMEKRLELGMEMTAPALADAFTKDELVKEAESAGVEAPSTMNKSELAEALVAKMAS
ncbi:MAG: hemerythrin domain-containing protein [Acidimicrobiales bacterium]|nr:hemerythrin domain-containing protein [Acidimicrobiales bacterium]